MKRFLTVLTTATLFIVFSGGAQTRRKPISVAAATAHSVTLILTPSASASACVSPCVMTYNIYRGTASGAENLVTPINPTPLTSANLSFTDANVSIGNTYFYVAQAVETSGNLVLTSPSSSEASAMFPPAPEPPGLAAKAN